MEGEQGSGWLGPWILGPLVLLLVMFFATSLLPNSDCSVIDDGSNPGGTAFAIIAGVCSFIAGVAAIVRWTAMWEQGDYLGRDVWLGRLALVGVMVGAGIGAGRDGEAALAGFLFAGLILMVLSLIALIVAAFMGKSTGDAGALVPIYLFGACLTYPLLAWVVLDLNNHPLC
ncbi:MAG TPA: hypothetical protein VFP21_02310 [Solirubrobacterales bacterium]|nr:hypothetical protein [Solirubrobacterales bacterium]